MTQLKLDLLPWMTSDATKMVFDILSQEGGEAKFVGGCVRDAVLEREVKDVDLACTHEPQTVMALLEEHGVKTFATGLKHGTITAVCDHGSEVSRFEITTLRKDVECDGRHAEVEFTDSWEEDAKRRDFTMNALYATRDGEVIDYFSGVEDAERGCVRFIGNPEKRIEEDGLRILRFFRFFAHYGTPPFDEASLNACGASAEMLDDISGERIQIEMLKLLSSDHPSDVLVEMQAQGILRRLKLDVDEKVLEALDLLPQNEKDIGVVVHPLRRLALILRGMKHPMECYQTIAQDWKLSNEAKKRLKALVEPSLIGMEAWHQSAQKRAIRRGGSQAFEDLVLIGWSEYLASHADKQREARETFGAMASFAENWPIPEFKMQGKDLAAIGVQEGPQMGQLLSQLEAWWEEKDYQPNKQELLEKAQRLLSHEDMD